MQLQCLPPEPSQPEEAKNEYGDLWAKRSAKPLPQIYGAIDRLGSGESVHFSIDIPTVSVILSTGTSSC